MAVPVVLSDLSVSEASNAPLDSESITPSTRPSDYMRTLGAFIRRMRAVGAPVASAATVNIGAITDGEYVHITGITTITAFDTIAAGVKRTLVFDGILTIQHNATTLILPGGVSATTAAGDVYEFTSEGSGNWRCTGNFNKPLGTTLTTIAAGNIAIAWPIGSVFIAVVSTNPATLLGGGTWVAFGAGRVLVGLDAAQTEFDLVEETGGAKTHTLTTAEIAAHTHTERAYTAGGGVVDGLTMTNGTTAANTAIETASTGGGGAHNNLQPYIVVYMWKRTA